MTDNLPNVTALRGKASPLVPVPALRGEVSPFQVLQLWDERHPGSQEPRNAIKSHHTTNHTQEFMGKCTGGWLSLFWWEAAGDWAGGRLYIGFPGGGVFQGGDFQSLDWWDFKASTGIGGVSSSGIGEVSGSGIGGYWSSGLGPFIVHSARHPKHKKKTQIYLEENLFPKQLYWAWYLILIFF